MRKFNAIIVLFAFTSLMFSEKAKGSDWTGVNRYSGINEANQQQQKRVYGTVTDQEGETLPYVTVLIKGTNIGTTTDENGLYEINVNGDVILIFSYMGFRDYEVSTAGKTRLDVTLLENNVRLEEVVVTGYNTVERKHLASSIESVDMERVVSRPIVKLEEAFSGTIPGVTMLQGSNLPGSVPGSISSVVSVHCRMRLRWSSWMGWNSRSPTWTPTRSRASTF